jgi:serine/threonine protein kinase
MYTYIYVYLSIYIYIYIYKAADRSLADVITHEQVAGKDWKQIRIIMEQIIENIEEIHSRGFIHGDLKPQNIGIRLQMAYDLIQRIVRNLVLLCICIHIYISYLMLLLYPPPSL